ncbi:MAG: PD-(D/E)XK nuclease family protein [Labilithrix sp.]|nr:PD-(D/E)XK nuclease family protein [Labilithrix sp.]
MKPIAGLGLGGPVVRADASAAPTLLGAPAWGPNGLLRDLELRLGLPHVDESTSARVPRWAARAKALADVSAFYTRSLAIDEVGTATTLLEWRDALVEAGWDGGPIARGGERLDALARLERHEGEPPPGRAERLVRCERALASAPSRLYDALTWPPYRITPSAGASDWPKLAACVARSRLGAVERLPSAIALDGRAYDDDALGKAVHAFLAADVDGLTPEGRLDRARALIEGWGVMGVVRAESLVRAGDTLRTWIEQRWPGARWHREIAIEGTVASEHGERRVSGIIDLLLETDAGYVIVDHKTIPGSTPAAWRAKCGSFIAQLAAYAIVLESAGGKGVEACWVHLPVGGGMVEVVLGGEVSWSCQRDDEAGSPPLATGGEGYGPSTSILQRSRQ